MYLNEASPEKNLTVFKVEFESQLNILTTLPLYLPLFLYLLGNYAEHFFQVIFAFCPPCSWFGGWLTFIIALCFIGILTAIVGDLASTFGCLVGLKAEVTAITFVALGTSLPDLFASKAAATGEKYADASIGNVTGSNSVNVFLGLGIPWVIASIYWETKVFFSFDFFAFCTSKAISVEVS